MTDLVNLTDKEWLLLVNKELKRTHRETISMWNCAEAGRMPPSHSVNAFGIETDDHIMAIRWAIKNRKFTPFTLDEVKKNGKMITSLVVTKDNPHKVEYVTLWDMVPEPTVRKK